MFIAFPPTFTFPSGLPKTFLPTHHIFYSQRLFDLKDGLPKYAKHKEEGAPMVDEEEDADRSHGHGDHEDEQEPTKERVADSNGEDGEENPAKRQKQE
jgi:hypothetical protein